MGGGCGNCWNHPIRRAIQKIKEIFGGSSTSTSNEVAQHDDFDLERATREETARINSSLTQFRIDTEAQSDKLENDIIKISRTSLDEFLDMLKKQNQKTFAGRKLNLNISAIERDNRETEDMIHGFIKKRVMVDVSLSNQECLEVLKMEKGEEKKKAMKKFLDKITSTAIIDLSEELRKVIRRQSENIEDRVQVRIDEIEASLDDNLKKFDKIKSLKETDSNELEAEKLELISVSSVCSMGMALLK